ncbi:hypothetical protein HK100_010759 [Physocladia obscura]|uniref:Uncharacterized protein n=1 Tax=Physocladia obscura TaxID=109957 RepID=A0AAD5T3F0_9FUNG|nr:hypothetical protein HK100_010759 [Physocladia obscura]
MEVYSVRFSAAECRPVVQSLNLQRGASLESAIAKLSSNSEDPVSVSKPKLNTIIEDKHQLEYTDSLQILSNTKNSKWSAFVEQSFSDNDSDSEKTTFSQPNTSGRLKRKLPEHQSGIDSTRPVPKIRPVKKAASNIRKSESYAPSSAKSKPGILSYSSSLFQNSKFSSRVDGLAIVNDDNKTQQLNVEYSTKIPTAITEKNQFKDVMEKAKISTNSRWSAFVEADEGNDFS